ncbi:MAG: LacI family DNA-binding transcriptional regulator [Chitinophagaceae bacterium]
MKKGITLKDIARKLNMSISTVSKALNNDNSISTLTKERVNEIAKEWQYVANESARNFQLNKSFTIGLILPDLLDQFFVMAINGVEEIAVKENYNIILTQSHEDVAREENIANVMIRNRVDGLIVAVTKNTVDMALFEKFKSVGIPVICIVREPQNNSFNYVSVNNAQGALKATNFLIKKGHRRIAHIMAPKTLQISLVRLEGYKHALKKNKIPLDIDLVKEVDFTKRETKKAMRELMKLESPPTGIFTFKNDITLDAIQFLKKKYPDKLDLIDFTDFGNLPFFDYLDKKPIASVDEDFYAVGKQAAIILFQMINEENQDENPQKIEISCRLVIHK